MSAARHGSTRLTGTVTAQREPVVELQIVGPLGQRLVACVVDTGFSGPLALPAELIRRLGLRQVGSTSATLADGSLVFLDRHDAEVHWLRGPQPVLVYATPGSDVLLGSALLAAHRLMIDYPARTVEVA